MIETSVVIATTSLLAEKPAGSDALCKGESELTMNGSKTDEPDAPGAEFKKTPFFQASNAARYNRQSLIKQINKIEKTRLICYVSSLGAPIDRDDPVVFQDLLYNLEDGEDVDLLLHTGGGDIDAAEKLIRMLRGKVGPARLRVVIPDLAKSAGTLMALGADVIIMSDTSEIGPIDPQVVRVDRDGNRTSQSVQDYLESFNELREGLAKHPNDVTRQILIGKMDAPTIKHFENVRDRAQRIAEKLLSSGMFKNGGNSTKVASSLIDTKEWPSHAQMISWEDATQLTLNVEYRPSTDEVWDMYWKLYCLQKIALVDGVRKLFESDYASLSIS
jgi:hypothetical protein